MPLPSVSLDQKASILKEDQDDGVAKNISCPMADQKDETDSAAVIMQADLIPECPNVLKDKPFLESSPVGLRGDDAASDAGSVSGSSSVGSVKLTEQMLVEEEKIHEETAREEDEYNKKLAEVRLQIIWLNNFKIYLMCPTVSPLWFHQPSG